MIRLLTSIPSLMRYRLGCRFPGFLIHFSLGSAALQFPLLCRQPGRTGRGSLSRKGRARAVRPPVVACRRSRAGVSGEGLDHGEICTGLEGGGHEGSPEVVRRARGDSRLPGAFPELSLRCIATVSERRRPQPNISPKAAASRVPPGVPSTQVLKRAASLPASRDWPVGNRDPRATGTSIARWYSSVGTRSRRQAARRTPRIPESALLADAGA